MAESLPPQGQQEQTIPVTQEVQPRQATQVTAGSVLAAMALEEQLLRGIKIEFAGYEPVEDQPEAKPEQND